MKHICVLSLVLLCVVPVLLWPAEELQHPALPASLAEEGFEVAAGRHPRSVRSTRSSSSSTSGGHKSGNKNPVPMEHKGSAHHSGPTHSPAHHSQLKSTKKVKLNRPTKPGKKHVPRHHQQKKHKKTTDSKIKFSQKLSVKSHTHKDKGRKSEE